MNRKISLFMIIAITVLFTSCSYLSKKSKENNHYTKSLELQLNSDYNYTCSIIDMNFYKQIDLQEDDFYILENFINTLTENSFIKKPDTLEKKPVYKITLNFDEEKFILNVYNNRYITLHPWDGKEEMDYIDMENIPASYNLFYLCNFIFSGKA